MTEAYWVRLSGLASAHNVIGSIDPSSMRETSAGLRVRGKLDLEESEVAREAWRSMKANRVALSFGYMVTDSAKRQDGVTELRSIDLFEISVVPAPANPDTRFLNLKAEARRGFDFAAIFDKLKDEEPQAIVTATKSRKRTEPIQVATFRL